MAAPTARIVSMCWLIHQDQTTTWECVCCAPKLLETELESLANVDTNSARTWRIENRGVHNAVGDAVAYKFLPVTIAYLSPALTPGGASAQVL